MSKRENEGLPNLDPGNFEPQDLERARRQMLKQNIAEWQRDPLQGMVASEFGQQFLYFVREVLVRLGHLDENLVGQGRLAVPIKVSEEATSAEIMKLAWGDRAKDWAIVESPANYLATISTILEFVRFDQEAKKEKILSLGAGPGLYEIFLAFLVSQMGIKGERRILCTDFSAEMVNKQREILALATTLFGRRATNIRNLVEDMTKLTLPANDVSQIICNNALQWVPDWRGAIGEMARVIKPQLGWLYLFVHPHPMRLVDATGEVVFEAGEFSIPELFDVLESNRFEIHHTRQIKGRRGTGQMGTATDRIFILAKYSAKGGIKSWREAKVSGAVSTMKL